MIGLLILYTWNRRAVFVANVAVMVLATIAVAMNSPVYLKAAFNPVSLNLAIIALSIVGWIASRKLPSAHACRRVAP